MHSWFITGTPWLRALLGFVFLLAAVSKLRDPEGFAAVVDALGFVRPPFRESLKVGVPLAEAGLGIALWTGWSPLCSAVTAAVVLVLLTVVLLKLRLAGYTGTCGCFIGARGGVGTLTIVRNAVLFVLSVWAGLGAYVAQSSFRLTSTSWERPPLLALVATLVAIGGYVLLTPKARVVHEASAPGPAASPEGILPKHLGRPTPESNPSGRGFGIFGEAAAPLTEVVPRIELTDLAGARVVLGRPKGNAQLVIFAKGRCPGCRRDRDIVNRLPVRSPMFETVIVCGGDLEETKEFASEVSPPVRVVADPRWRTAIAWQVTTTPFSVVIDHHGRVRRRGHLASALSLLVPYVES